MAVNWPGLVSVGVCYIIVLATGIWASRKAKREEKKCADRCSEFAMVGGRNLNILVSIFTMTATWVGGGYILGTAEVIYDPTKGLVWSIGPIACFLNLILGGMFFTIPMRSKNYVTLMDPFQEKYGNTIAAVLFIPCILSDIVLAACILGALGTVSVVMDIPSSAAVCISAALAVFYTAMGGLYSVAYTDVVQLIFIVLGLWFCVPFILTSPSASNFTAAAVNKLYQDPWFGKLELEDAGYWIDNLLLLSIGGLCYQSFYQRVLSAATDAQAKITCYIGGVLCPFFGIPSIIAGAVAASTNWNQTTFGSPSPYEQGKAGMILPIVLQHLCPFYVSAIGMGALSAVVMSSLDSVLLSAASQLARNIYKNIIYRQASERSILVVLKVSVLLFGVTGASLALTTSSVILLWVLSSDVLYSIMAPQVICVLHLSERVNVYGACSGFVFSLILRAVVGEPTVGLPDLLPLPWDRIQEDGHRNRLFPFRTAIMLLTFVVILLASQVSVWLKGKLLLRSDSQLNEMHDLGLNRKNVEENEALNQDEEPSHPA